VFTACLTSLVCLALGPSDVNAQPAPRPNIVYVMVDNYGGGGPGVYGGGILRGVPKRNIDKLAAEGYRLLNFNVESQGVPSRSALMWPCALPSDHAV
jgi:hypothetical protein